MKPGAEAKAGKRALPWLYLLAGLVLAGLPLVVTHPYIVHILILFFFFSYLALAWNLIGGYGGQLSLGHSVFYGLGAYTSTLLFVHFGLSPWIGMLAGGLLATGTSLLIGYPCFRLHGPFFAMSTLALLEVFRILTVYFSGLTNGSVGITIPLKFGLVDFVFRGKTTYLYIMMALFVGAVLVTKLVERSRFGYDLIALREDEDTAESAGVNVNRSKLKAMALSAFLTALAGTFHAQYALYIDPSGEFSMSLSVLMAIMCILGSAGTLFGPILGAAFLVPLQEILRGTLGNQLYGLHLFIYGLLLVLVVLFLPQGIFTAIQGWLGSRGKGDEEAGDKAAGEVIRLQPASRASQEPSAALEPILTTRALSKSFGGLLAVNNLDMQVQQGSITGLIGPNGAGKTTLFNLISGFLRPDAGKIHYWSRDITNLHPAHKLCRLGIGRTFQIVQPFDNISVLRNLMAGAFAKSARESEARQRSLAVLDFIGLYGKRNQLPGNLTLGDRKRLELGRALAGQPDLLLLDEIMAGLTPREISEAINLIERIRELGITVILIEHVMQAVMNLSDWVVILNYGQKIAEGEPAVVANDEEVIKAYLGEDDAAA